MKSLIIFCAIAIVPISAQLLGITTIVELVAGIGDKLNNVFIDFDLEQLGVDEQQNDELQAALDLAQENLQAEELRTQLKFKTIHDAAKTVDTSVDRLREDLARLSKEDVINDDLDKVKGNIDHLLSTTKN